jgi:hypothetical protein
MQFSFMWWYRCCVLAFSTQVHRFKHGRHLRIFKGEGILGTPSFGGEVNLSVTCRRVAACKRSLYGVEFVISAKITGQRSHPQFRHSLLGLLATLWTWTHMVATVGILNVGEGNGKLPLWTWLECNVPEPIPSPDWTLVPAQADPRAEY